MNRNLNFCSLSAKIKGISATVILITSLSAQAQNAPTEQTSAALTRQPSSPNSGTVRLSKNLFRTETVQVPYVEKVPYQETETYVEQVPYTVSVPYTDYETDYRDEYRCENVTKYKDETRCENVTRYRDEYRCENVTRYRDEQRCENVTRYRQECRNEQRCYLVPGEPGQCRQVEECGTNAQGQPICKTRQVCDGGTGPQQRCENERRCENVPYTDRECRTERVPYYEQECRNERVPYTDRECRTERIPYVDQVCSNVRVPYQREVTRYRDETRYRSETRTRTVTKYRDETKCCRSETREVFDRQLQFQVQVSFPSEAVLAANEIETLVLSLTSAQPGSVSVDARKAIYNYTVASQSASGEIINVRLALVPKFDLSNAGEASIQLRARYSVDQNRFMVLVNDSVLDSNVTGRLSSQRMLAINDLQTGALIEEQLVKSLPNGQMGVVLNTSMSPQSKFRMTLSVIRTGALVSGGQINFVKTSNYERKTVTSSDVAALGNSSLVKLAVANAQGQSAALSLIDSSEEFADVSTVYSVTVYELIGQDRTQLTQVNLSREQLKSNGEKLLLSQLLGAKAKSALVAGKQLRLHIAITRTGDAGSALGQSIQLVSKANISIK